MKCILPGAFFVLLMVCATGCAVAQDKYLQIQMLQRQIESLQAERAVRYDELAKCEKNTKTYKIVGISAASVAGVGLMVNAKLYKRLNDLNGSGGGGKSLSDGRSQEEKDLASQWAILDCDSDDGWNANQQKCEHLARLLGV